MARKVGVLTENRMNTLLPATIESAPSSRVLQQLLAQAPADFFTLAWLTSFLRERSFGIMLLFCRSARHDPGRLDDPEFAAPGLGNPAARRLA